MQCFNSILNWNNKSKIVRDYNDDDECHRYLMTRGGVGWWGEERETPFYKPAEMMSIVQQMKNMIIIMLMTVTIIREDARMEKNDKW